MTEQNEQAERNEQAEQTERTPAPGPDYERRLAALSGREVHPPRTAPDPVNQPMIRHWAEAMGDPNPVHLDHDAARASGRPGVVAPAAMTQAWTMRGYAAVPTRQPETELETLLAEGGYTSVVATDSELELSRELTLGERISVRETIESISAEKATSLGTGRFVTTLRTYRDASGETVATQRWRTLRFRPPAADRSAETADSPEHGERREAAESAGEAEAGAGSGERRPRPALNDDNRFWFEAAREHRLVIQRCAECGEKRHPPGPCCPHCRSFDWDTVEAAGVGEVYSYVVNHHPRHPAFGYPLVVAVVELTEGVRLITNLTGARPEEVHVGMPVLLDWLDADEELSLPVFRPRPRETETPAHESRTRTPENRKRTPEKETRTPEGAPRTPRTEARQARTSEPQAREES